MKILFYNKCKKKLNKDENGNDLNILNENEADTIKLNPDEENLRNELSQKLRPHEVE